MSTLATLRAALRTDLHDEDALAYRWTDAELDRHIQRAVERYQDTNPQDKNKDIATLNDVYHYVLTGGDAIADLHSIERVEYPQGQNPPVYTPWELRGISLTIFPNTPPVSGEFLRVHYAATHLVNSSGSTIPLVDEWILVLGAASYAALALGLYASGRVNVSTTTQKEWETFGYRRGQEFSRELDRLRRERTQRAGSTAPISGYEV